MRKASLALVAPAIENGTVTDRVLPFPGKRRPPPRPTNAAVRSREYLTKDEVERLLKAAAGNRHGHRDKTLILVASRHGLRVSEIIDLRWDQIDFGRGELHVRRVKHGSPATHPIPGRELRWLRQLERGQRPKSAFVFTSERGTPFTSRGIHKMVARAGVGAGLPFPVHPHMLRHTTGYVFANNGVDTRTIQKYLGHRNIQHTVRYTELSAKQFRNLWDD
jgi:type 1 fimbriae regulatory protein FimB/type 1 fimbriae regulatory protein FimE